jgi:hypothetical protein
MLANQTPFWNVRGMKSWWRERRRIRRTRKRAYRMGKKNEVKMRS